MDPSCTWPGSQPDDLRRSGQASVLSCLRGTRKVRGRYIAGGDVSRATARTKSRRTAPARRRHPRTGAQGRVTPPTNARASRARSARPAKCHGLPDRYPSHQRTAFPPARAPGKHRGRRADTGGARPTRRRVKPEQAARAARPWLSVQTRRVHRPSRRPARRPLCVRGCRNTAPNSATR